MTNVNKDWPGLFNHRLHRAYLLTHIFIRLQLPRYIRKLSCYVFIKLNAIQSVSKFEEKKLLLKTLYQYSVDLLIVKLKVGGIC